VSQVQVCSVTNMQPAQLQVEKLRVTLLELILSQFSPLQTLTHQFLNIPLMSWSSNFSDLTGIWTKFCINVSKPYMLQPIHMTFCALIMYGFYIYSEAVRTTVCIHGRIDRKKLPLSVSIPQQCVKASWVNLWRGNLWLWKQVRCLICLWASDSDLATMEEGWSYEEVETEQFYSGIVMLNDVLVPIRRLWWSSG
jgi:hypothetical protein